jgi:hypothetical protein
MSLADACLVRMSETLPKPVLLTTDNDFRIYRRHGPAGGALRAPRVTREEQIVEQRPLLFIRRK